MLAARPGAVAFPVFSRIILARPAIFRSIPVGVDRGHSAMVDGGGAVVVRPGRGSKRSHCESRILGVLTLMTSLVLAHSPLAIIGYNGAI